MGKLNKLIFHPSFKYLLQQIRQLNVTLTQVYENEEYNFSNLKFPSHGNLDALEDIGTYTLSGEEGNEFAKGRDVFFAGYDESKFHYSALEGHAYFTAHSLIFCDKREYLPVIKISFNFYSKSEKLCNLYPLFNNSSDPEKKSNEDYVLERNDFILEYSVENTIVFIDGPLIGGNISHYTVKLVRKLHDKNIIPIFIVKNSDSNMVTDNMEDLGKDYNSDMHWSYNILKEGSRTNFFKYTDAKNPNFSKIFCYIKAYKGLSPQRVEFHSETFIRYHSKIPNIMNLIYYLFLVHGDTKNPQVRPIVIAEQYAREAIKTTNTYALIKSSGLIPTMNQERFGS